MSKLRDVVTRLSCIRLFESVVVLIASNVAVVGAQPVNAPQARRVNTHVEGRIQDEYGLPAIDAVRLHLWSFFGTVEKFADGVEVPRHALQRWLAENGWELPTAPALALQNKDLTERDPLCVSSGQRAPVRRFVSRDGQPAQPVTEASIDCNRDDIIVSITCHEPNLDRLTADVPANSRLSDQQRRFWGGDMVALKKAFQKNTREIGAWAEKQEKPLQSVLLDDCVLVMLTPLAIGKDRSYLFPGAFVPDPAKWFRQTRPPRESRVYLEGAYYGIAVNPNGAVLDVFFDPWDSGTVCPAWPSRAQVTTRKGDGFWRVDLRIPWTSLKPNVAEDSLWGIDLARIRRCGDSPEQVTRSPQPTLLRYDVPISQPVIRLPPTPEISVDPLLAGEPVSTFPAPGQWAEAAIITAFRDNRSGQKAADMVARIACDRKTLFVRFDCREQDLDRLRVVTRAEEENEYGPQSRRCHYVDRREHFGLDWGDYVEVLLAPNLDFADRHHGGLFTFLVNSHGDLLQRYYDPCGMFNVSPYPLWSSGAKTRVTKSGDSWTVELAIPFGVLCTMDKVSSTWGLNLHRAQSSRVPDGRQRHLCWSQAQPSFEAPGWPVSLRSLRDGRRLGQMYIKPDHVQLESDSNRPTLAVARSVVSAARSPAVRRRQSDRLASVSFVDRLHGWAAGGLGTILHTADGGETWDEQDSGTDFILERVFFVDRNHGWAIGGWPRDAAVSVYGGMGVILVTADGGRHWSKQLDGEATWLKDVFFLNPRQGWAVGEYGMVLKTTDGGGHWRPIRRTGTPSWLYGVAFVNERCGLAVGHDETILRTDDGGESWTVQPTPAPRRVNGWPAAYRAVAFADQQRGWIVGDDGTILGTTDGGGSWQLEPLALPDAAVELASFESLTVAPDGTAWAVSPVAILRRRPDEELWRVVSTGQRGWFCSVSFPDASAGWLVGQRGLVLQTPDGGKTWAGQRDSGRPVGLLYATAHDHHINNAPLGPLSESFDTAYVCCGRGVRPFELGGDYNRHMVAAAAMASGVPVVHSFVEYAWRERDLPHCIADRYQHYGGIGGIERRLVAMIRTLRPRILVAEQPVIQEGYYAHGVGEVARALIFAFDSAADREQFPELLQLGLEPYAPRKLYVLSSWANELYGIHPTTLRVTASGDQFSERLGMTFGQAKARSRNCFWGLLDRPLPPKDFLGVGAWNLHLKRSHGDVKMPELDLFDQ